MVRAVVVAGLLGCASGSAWSDFLDGLGGDADAFDWKAACKALGQTPSGYGSSSSGGETTFDLTCDSNAISVVCDGSACTSEYEPPATAGDTPPTGDYNVEVDGTCDHGGFSAEQVQQMLNFHNKMRCAVGAPPVSWNADLECQAQDTQAEIGAFEHSKCYELPIPAGENLATGKEVAASAWMWFTEYLQGNHEFDAFNHGTGHFSAMVWKSVKTIGCGVGPDDEGGKGVVRCQYDSGSDTAANMEGGFEDNMPMDFRGTPDDFSNCGMTAEEVKAKAELFSGWGILSPSGEEASNIGLYSLPEQIFHPSSWRGASVAKSIAVCGAISAMAFVVVRVVKSRRSQVADSSQDGEELLVAEE